jgi:RimJ/RimL family protein N-acetyltransferase
MPEWSQNKDDIIVYRTGENVVLCPIRTEDVKIYQRWLNDHEVLQFLTQVYPLTTEGEQLWLEQLTEQNPTHVILAIRLKDSLRLVGNCSLFKIDPVHRSACLGIVIGEKSQWSKGYGTEATRIIMDVGFRDLNLHRIYLDVHDFNARAIRCYQKLGFVKEGEFRQAIYINGQYHNTIRMGILNEEWFKLQPEPVCPI